MYGSSPLRFKFHGRGDVFRVGGYGYYFTERPVPYGNGNKGGGGKKSRKEFWEGFSSAWESYGKGILQAGATRALGNVDANSVL